MKNSPLRLEQYFVTSLKLEANSEAEKHAAPVITARPDVSQHPSDPLKWMVLLEVELKSGEKAPAAYTGQVHFAGFFAVDPKWPQDKIRKLVEVNGSTLLYSAVREMIANVTSRGPWPMVVLPSVSFVEDAPKPKGTAVSSNPPPPGSKV